MGQICLLLGASERSLRYELPETDYEHYLGFFHPQGGRVGTTRQGTVFSLRPVSTD